MIPNHGKGLYKTYSSRGDIFWQKENLCHLFKCKRTSSWTSWTTTWKSTEGQYIILFYSFWKNDGTGKRSQITQIYPINSLTNNSHKLNQIFRTDSVEFSEHLRTNEVLINKNLYDVFFITANQRKLRSRFQHECEWIILLIVTYNYIK